MTYQAVLFKTTEGLKTPGVNWVPRNPGSAEKILRGGLEERKKMDKGKKGGGREFPPKTRGIQSLHYILWTHDMVGGVGGNIGEKPRWDAKGP